MTPPAAAASDDARFLPLAPKNAAARPLHTIPRLSMDPKFDAALKALMKGLWFMVWWQNLVLVKWQNCLRLPCCYRDLHPTLFTAVHEDDVAESAFWKQVIVLSMPP
jgi:hypothetical protein